jgi:hypothetical protein
MTATTSTDTSTHDDTNDNQHHLPAETNGEKISHDHPPPVIVQETDDEDDFLLEPNNDTAAISLLEIDEETLNSGAEGCVILRYFISLICFK